MHDFEFLLKHSCTRLACWQENIGLCKPCTHMRCVMLAQMLPAAAHLWSQAWHVVDCIKACHVHPRAVDDSDYVIKRDAALSNVGGKDHLAHAWGCKARRQ